MEQIKLINYPRSGGNFFEINYGECCNNNILFSHDIEKIGDGSGVVTIIRDPLESIASAIAMSVSNGFLKVDQISWEIKKFVAMYTNMYKKMTNLDGVVYIRFEDVTNNFNRVSKAVAEIFSHKHSFLESFKRTTRSRDNLGYVETSQILNAYDIVKSKISKSDLSECYALFDQVNLLAIKVDR